MPPSTQTRVIRIVVDAPGAKDALDRLSSSMGQVNKNTKDLAKGMGFLTTATSAWIGGISVGSLTRFSDEIQNLNNRLKAMSGSQEGATDTMNRLVDVSRETNQSITSVADSYLRMSLALKDANISQSTMIDLTKTVANTFRLSGATAEEASNATVQLGQAFSLGVLRGQDLRSIMSQNVVLTQLLRKEFGNNLLKAAEKGLITVPKLMEIIYQNMEQVNTSAKTMSATFEQTAVKALDAFKLSVFKVSESLGASSAFAKGMDTIIANMDRLVLVLIVLSTSAIPKVITSIGALAASFTPITAAIAIMAGLVSAVLSFAPAATSTLDPLDQLARAVLQLNIYLTESLEIWTRYLQYLPRIGGLFKAIHDLSKGISEAYKKEVERLDDLAQSRVYDAIIKKYTAIRNSVNGFKGDIDKANKAFPTDLDPKQQLAKLNKELNEGRITLAEYNKKILEFDLSKANYEFKEGSIQASKLYDAQKKVAELDLNQKLAEGTISLQEYNKAIEAVKMQDLNRDLEAGIITLEQYNKKLASVSEQFSVSGAFRTGLQDYISAVGTTTQQVAGAISSAFKGLEDQLVNFVKKGKLDFRSFTQSILDDLTRIVIRASIVQPLAGAVLSSFAPAASAASTSPQATYGGSNLAYSAKGNVFDGGLKKFATGGIVSSPTMFGYGSGKRGIMGEAGPEAILPLQRGKGGNLGVAATVTPVTVNVINQSGNTVEQNESTGPNGEKTIEIIVTNKVREGIVTGKFDKVFKQSYGLNRKGS